MIYIIQQFYYCASTSSPQNCDPLKIEIISTIIADGKVKCDKVQEDSQSEDRGM